MSKSIPEPQQLRPFLAQEVKDSDKARRSALATLDKLEYRTHPEPDEATLAEARYVVDLADYHWRQAKRFFASLGDLFDFATGRYNSGRSREDLIPFAEAWPERGVFIEGIENPHLQDLEGKPDKPQPPERPVPAPLPVSPKPTPASTADAAGPASTPKAERVQPSGKSMKNTASEAEEDIWIVPPAPPPGSDRVPNATGSDTPSAVESRPSEPALPARADAGPAATRFEAQPGPDPARRVEHRETDALAKTGAPKPRSPVGYKVPPEHGKFRPNDGRPRPGRPKGSKNVATYVRKAATRSVRTRDERTGRVQKMPQLQAIVEQTFGDALEGKDKARDKVFSLAERHMEVEKEVTGPPEATEADLMVLKTYAAILKFLEGADNDDKGKS